MSFYKNYLIPKWSGFVHEPAARLLVNHNTKSLRLIREFLWSAFNNYKVIIVSSYFGKTKRWSLGHNFSQHRNVRIVVGSVLPKQWRNSGLCASNALIVFSKNPLLSKVSDFFILAHSESHLAVLLKIGIIKNLLIFRRSLFLKVCALYRRLKPSW